MLTRCPRFYAPGTDPMIQRIQNGLLVIAGVLVVMCLGMIAMVAVYG